VLAPFSDSAALVFGLNGLAFHCGILAFQGLDFVSWWMPALFAFIVPINAPWHELLLAGWREETPWFLPAAIYTALQVLAAATLYDLWLDDVLPFSCCPMFMPPRNPFDTLPKWWTMADAPISGRTRDAGAMEPLYWSPASCVFEMPVEEAALLPQKVVWFGSSTGTPAEVTKFIAPACRNKPFMLFANFELSAELKQLLHRVVEEANSGELDFAWDVNKMRQLLALQQECLDAFQSCVSALRAKERANERANAVAERLAASPTKYDTKQQPAIKSKATTSGHSQSKGQNGHSLKRE